MLRILDLFSGIGGFSLGLERAGMRTVAFCEIDPYCRRILAKHWPGVPIYDDVRTLTAARLAADGIIDAMDDPSSRRLYEPQNWKDRQQGEATTVGSGIGLICGGFPCQDISVAGKGAGIDGARSGLWSEYTRIIGEVRPRYVLIENVAALLGRGLVRVLGDLAALGYDAEWICIRASDVGAPHQRDRVWIVAYAIGAGLERRASFGSDVAAERQAAERGCEVSDADEQPARRVTIPWGECDWWKSEPNVGRVAHGVPNRVDRLRSLGNAVVPQIVELIGLAIVEADMMHMREAAE